MSSPFAFAFAACSLRSGTRPAAADISLLFSSFFFSGATNASHVSLRLEDAMIAVIAIWSRAIADGTRQGRRGHHSSGIARGSGAGALGIARSGQNEGRRPPSDAWRLAFQSFIIASIVE
jgi:hypothetical protein